MIITSFGSIFWLSHVRTLFISKYLSTEYAICGLYPMYFLLPYCITISMDNHTGTNQAMLEIYFLLL